MSIHFWRSLNPVVYAIWINFCLCDCQSFTPKQTEEEKDIMNPIKTWSYIDSACSVVWFVSWFMAGIQCYKKQKGRKIE